jgi:uncharacterized OB-fold protein
MPGTPTASKTAIARPPPTRAHAATKRLVRAAADEGVRAADKVAKIVTYTADSLSFSPDPPVYYGAIDFEGGGRLVAEFADCSAEDVEVGREMRMVFRIKAVDQARDFTKYFWKAVPVQKGDA